MIPDVEGSANLPDFRNFGVQFDPTLGAFMMWDGSSGVWLLTPPEDLDSNNHGILDVATGWQLKMIDVSGVGTQMTIPKIHRRFREVGLYGGVQRLPRSH